MSWDLFEAAESSEPSGNEVSEPRRQPRRSPIPEGLPLDSLRAAGARAGDEWTVGQVNDAARELLEGVFPPLWVSGEIANFTRAKSGHCYFSLRDNSAQLRCVMWRDDAVRLPTPPQEGMSIRAFGRLTLYRSRGEFQLSVSRLEARGEGLWKLALERLRTKLETEGLTAPQRKRPLPRHPEAIGVVTSPSGAVFHDIVNVVRRRAPWTRVLLAGCRVQGEGAAAEIVRAIQLIADRGRVDAIIVGRGGGSIEDLWAFNDERVARAIAACPIPVISAVGHETDVTIADLVADLRSPTPSAAAEACVPDREELHRNLQRDGWRLSRGIAMRLGRAQEAVANAGIDLRACGDRMIAMRREMLGHAARQLDDLSPLSAFRRGYAVPVSENGSILRRTEDFPAERTFDLRVLDGSVRCRSLGPNESRTNNPDFSDDGRA